MGAQLYSVTPQPVETILAWVKSGEIAVPEIQRPFVWDATKVRNLLDSLYRGYPVGYLIVWKNPNVRLKDGSLSAGKRILIDGQQRVTALMAALLGHDVVSKDYEKTRIRIAFHPNTEEFQVSNPAIRKDPEWIPDVAEIFDPQASIYNLVIRYCARNPGQSENSISARIESVRKLVNNAVGIVELAEDLDIDTVTEIFIRVNSAGVDLSQADFAMSKIAVNDAHGGPLLRKAIDYFCRGVVEKSFVDVATRTDPAFAASSFCGKMKWLTRKSDSDIYEPEYTDMLRVAFTSEFRRGKLQDLVAMLSGRNFEKQTYEEETVHSNCLGAELPRLLTKHTFSSSRCLLDRRDSLVRI